MRFHPEECAGCGRCFEPMDWVVKYGIAGEVVFTCMDNDCEDELAEKLFDNGELESLDLSDAVVDTGYASDFEEIKEVWDEPTLREIEAWAYDHRG